MNMQSSVQSWAIASRLFLASRSPNTSWRLRLMRVSMEFMDIAAVMSVTAWDLPEVASPKRIPPHFHHRARARSLHRRQNGPNFEGFSELGESNRVVDYHRRLVTLKVCELKRLVIDQDDDAFLRGQ